MFGIEWKYILIAVFVLAFAVVFVITFFRNSRIRRNGVIADAVVSGIEEHDHIDGDGSLSFTYSYYVMYEDREGNTHEAILSKVMNSRYRVGDELQIRYLPENPQYAYPMKGRQERKI